jgi:hypothetical protein
MTISRAGTSTADETNKHSLPEFGQWTTLVQSANKNSSDSARAFIRTNRAAQSVHGAKVAAQVAERECNRNLPELACPARDISHDQETKLVPGYMSILHRGLACSRAFFI